MSDDKNIILKEIGIGFFKGVIGAVPHVGALLNEALFDIRSRIKQARLEQFLTELSLAVKVLEKNINESTIKSEGFIDLLEDTIQKVVRNRSEEKRKIFAHILVSAMCENPIEDLDVKQMFLSVIDSLNEHELSVLRSLYLYSKKADEFFRANGKELELKEIDYNERQIFGLNTEDFILCFETLIAKGLVFDDSFGRWSTKPRSFIKPTRLALELIKFINEITPA